MVNTKLSEQTDMTFNSEKEYWFHKLSEDIEKSYFPYDTIIDLTRNKKYEDLELVFDSTITNKLLKLSNDSDFRLYVIFVAGIALLLKKVTGIHTNYIESPILKQENDTNLLNTILILCNKTREAKTFKDFLLLTKNEIVTAIKNQNYPISALLNQLQLNNEVTDPFDVAVLYKNIHNIEYLKDRTYSIVFTFERTINSINCITRFDTSKYKKETIVQLFNRLETLFSRILEDIDTPLNTLEIILPEEKSKIINIFNDTKVEFDRTKLFHEYFEEQVIRSPYKIAIDYIDHKVTYNFLNKRTSEFADYLKSLGIATNSMVAMYFDRCVEFLIGILSIFKAGGAYVPLDTDIPLERIINVLEDSDAKVLIINREIKDENIRKIKSRINIPIVFIDSFIKNDDYVLFDKTSQILHTSDNSAKPYDEHSLSYMIYTSGTTGKPKGVMIHQLGMINHLHGKINDLSLNENDRIAQTASVSFDISVWQFLAALIVGGSVHIIDKETVLKPMKFLRILQQKSITILESVPSLMSVFLEAIEGGSNDLSDLRWMIPTGESLSNSLVKEWFLKFPEIKLVNAYGPTEASDDITHAIIDSNSFDTSQVIPVGSPIQNTHIYILDEDNLLCPPKITGEICVAGIGVGKGYWNDEVKTNKAFIPNPIIDYIQEKEYKILYKTGDIGYFQEDGNVICLGRKDFQVKIRGNRIEIAEVEYHISRYPQITDVIVLVKKINNENQLCAYVISKNRDVIKDLKVFLRKEIPEYMIPGFFTIMDEFPHSISGKIDRKRLTEPDTFNKSFEDVAPRNELEKHIVKIWEDVLGRKEIGINENFFEIGGDSIKSIQIISKLNKNGYNVEAKDLFQYPTIIELSKQINETFYISNQETVRGEFDLVPSQIEFFNFYGFTEYNFNQAILLKIKSKVYKGTLETLFSKIVEHHDILRSKFYKKGDKYVQYIENMIDSVSVSEYDISGDDEKNKLRDKIKYIQSEIELQTAPLFRIALFHMSDGDRLLIAMHHLIVDGVSWRILFEDLVTLHKQYEENEELQLPLKTDSFKRWSEKIKIYSSDESLLNEIDYWKSQEEKESVKIQPDYSVKQNLIKDREEISFSLSKNDTEILITKINQVHKFNVNDILLGALSKAYQNQFDQDYLKLALEGHGREDIGAVVNITRTIGWFTTTFPVVLTINKEHNMLDHIYETKAILSHIPNKGIGYGILKYITNNKYKTDITFKQNPQIVFNYLGDISENTNNSVFQIADEEVLDSVNGNLSTEFEIEIIAMVKDSNMSISIFYNKHSYKKETIEKLVNVYKYNLESVINKSYDITRFGVKGIKLPEEHIRDISKLHNTHIQKVYPLTHMQMGMLFHSIYDKDKPVYCVQTSFGFKGDVCIDTFTKSINEIIKRHDILRTIFVFERVDEPVQVVLENREIVIDYKDLRESESKCQQEEIINSIKDKYKKKIYKLDQDLLFSLSLLQISDDKYEIIFNYHHLLFDGWCIPLLNMELAEIYHSYKNERMYKLPKIVPFENYVNWLHSKDKVENDKYWNRYLHGFTKPTSLPSDVVEEHRDYIPRQTNSLINKELVAGLSRIAGKNRVTLNTIFQTIWSLILGRFNETEDVVFGAIVSGRPEELQGIDTTIGLFINTIPVRIQFSSEKKFSDLIREVQDKAIESAPYHYFPLSDIQAKCQVKNNLLDHILVFENFPKSKNPFKMNKWNLVEDDSTRLMLETNYNLNINIIQDEELLINFMYNEASYSESRIQRVSEFMNNVITQIVKNDEILIGNISILGNDESNCTQDRSLENETTIYAEFNF